MKLKKGDFVKLDYVGRVKATGNIFDLTDEKIAKKEGIFNEKAKYEPAVAVIGANHLVRGLDEELIGKETGKDYTIEIPADAGFGARSPDLVKVFPKNKFRGQKGPLFPGAQVTIQGINGIVSSVSGGRVRVDFNHPLAGKELVYKVKIISTVKGTKERVESLLDLHAPFSGFEVKASEKTATITVPNMAPPQWFQVQGRVANEIIEYAGLADVKFVQEYKKAEKQSKTGGKKDK